MDELKYISDIDVLKPANSDLAGEGANEIRKLKEAIKNSFPNIDKEVTITSDKLNGLDENFDFNKLDESENIEITLPEYADDDGFLNEIQVQNIVSDDGEGNDIETVTLEKSIDAGPIGAIQSFPFDQDLIDLIYGPNIFVLAHGQDLPDVTDPNDRSMYEKIFATKTIVDMRGVVPRGHDPRIYADDYLTNDDSGKNPGNPALGEFQDDSFREHTHLIAMRKSRAYASDNRVNIYHYQDGGSNHESNNTIGKTGIETRAKSLIINYFVRIN